MKRNPINGSLSLLAGALALIGTVAATFKEYPPRSVPPSFNPSTILDETLREIKVEKKLKTAFPMLKEEGSK